MCKYYQKINSYIYKCITEQEYVQLVKDRKIEVDNFSILFIALFFIFIIWMIIKWQIEKLESKNNL